MRQFTRKKGIVFVNVPNPKTGTATGEAYYNGWINAGKCLVENIQSTAPAPAPAPPKPVCPVLAALDKLTTTYRGGDGYFILDEILLTVRQETTISRDALLEKLRSHYRDGKVLFRQGYGSQLQFSLPEDSE